MSERDRKNWPKISIVTPSYNQGQYIEDTILSVIEQSYPNLEYIIIDGGSTDNTVEIIKKYEKYIFYWVSEPDGGQGNAINKGLVKCTGDIFNWVNSDDLLSPKSLFLVSHYFQQYPIKVLAGYRRRFSDKNKLFPIDKKLDRVKLGKDTEDTLLNNHFIQLPTFFSLNSIVSLNGVNPTFSYVMDSELWLRFLLKHGQQSVMTINESLGYFRLHAKSKTVGHAQKFKIEANEFSYQLYATAGVPLDIANILFQCQPKLQANYDLTNVEIKKIRQFAYRKLLIHHISLKYPFQFFPYFIDYVKISNSLWQPLKILFLIFKKRLKARS